MEILKIAVQKKGRLHDKSVELMKKCGLDFSSKNGQLIAVTDNFPIEFLFLRDDDIPGYVADGVADIGIVGLNEVDEKNKDLTIVEKLGFSKCRISIAVPNKFKYNSIQDLNGKSIATSYPVILSKFLDENNVNCKIQEIGGSVEIAPTIGLADAICDIVSSGSTLLSNGLKEVEKFYFSQAVLIANNSLTEEQNNLLNKLLIRIRSVNKAKRTKYILLNTPNEKIETIKEILPGMKSPTIMPLAEEGWSSVHSVIEEDKFWEIIEKLKEAGAQGILVIPIEKMIL